MNDEGTFVRWAAIAGFGVLAFGAAAVSFERGAPTGDSAAALTAFYARNGDALRWQSLLFLVGAGLFLWYVTGLRTFLARTGTVHLATLVFGAGVAWTAVSAAAQAAQIGASMGAESGEVAPALVDTMTALFTGASLLLAVLLGAVAAAAFLGGAFPTWLAWLAAAAAAASLLPLCGIVVEHGPLAADGWATVYVPYPVLVAWLAAAAAVMFRRARADGP